MARTATSATAHVIVVDDEPLIGQSIGEFLSGHGFQVSVFGSGEEALAAAESTRFDVMLCDVNLPGMDGLEVLDRLLTLHPEALVLLITAYATVESAVEAFQRGAQDYLMKPILLDEVLGKIRRLLATRDLARENQYLRRELNRRDDGSSVVGRGPEMLRLQEMVRRVGPTPSTVLILGESGTGKEVLARAIHREAVASGRADDRFLAVNCAAIPSDLLENQLFGHRRGAFTGADRDASGVFVHAGSGTVFLDEVGELPQATQAKLLRALEQKEILPVGANEPMKVACRILAATNKTLLREVEQGRFREDLFYRLNVVTLTLPPLRERREDIPELAEFLLAKHSRALGKRFVGVSHTTMQLLLACPWKGNIRELDNVLQRAVILGDGPLVEPIDLPPDLAPRENDPSLVEDLGEAIRRFERLHIERMLRAMPDKKEAARRLGIGLSSLYRKIDELNIRLAT